MNAEENIERRMKKDGLKDIELVINRNDVRAIDRFGRRWVRCSVCGRIDYESEFSTYTVNIGTCKRCYRANRSNE